MRSNFRPNIRLATNILLVIGTFAIALKISPIAEVYQEKNLCIKYLKHQIDRDKLINRLKIVNQANPSSICLLYTSPSPRDLSTSRMPSSA